MESLTKDGIPEERIINSKENASILKRLDCSICLNILWKPVCCAKCQTSFCEKCINRWVSQKQVAVAKCPNQCTYSKVNSPPIIIDLLSDLKITCGYKESGCTEILSYEQLEKHEITCTFQSKECQGFKILTPR